MWETVVGKLLSWVPAPWSGIRLGQESTATLCTFGHPLMFYLGDPTPRGPLHIDVSLRLWSRRGEKTTVRGLSAKGPRQELEVGGLLLFHEMTLEPGAPPEEQHVELHPPKGQVLQADAGDHVELRLVLTRGRAKKLRLRIEPERGQ